MVQRWTFEQFSQTLDQRLDELMKGQVLLQDLPLAVAAWFYAGEAYGRADRQLEIDLLEHEANILWMQAFTPKERHAEYQRRLDEHFRLEEQRFFDAAIQQQQDGTTTIEPAMNAEIEGKDGRDSGTTGTSQQAA